jgi:3-isopropylmalate/(R)-2-methylmalate dehydratase large subunit
MKMSGQTISEKIISSHSGSKKKLKAGDFSVVSVDKCFSHDASGPLLISQLNSIKNREIGEWASTIFFIDHAVPSPRKELSNDQNLVREFALSNGLVLSDAGNGICHQVMAEDYASPGQLIVGTDSHTCMLGALGAFATGMGATDIAVAMKFRKTWLRVPETIRIEIDGELPKGVFAKDVILNILGVLRCDGASYKALEFCGPTVKRMRMYERFTLTNMAVEAGAKNGIIAPDAETRNYLAKYGRENEFEEIFSDENAVYENTLSLDVSHLEPTVALPHSPDNIRPISHVRDVRIDSVFIGSCTNTRIEDLEIVNKILSRNGKARRIQLVVTPASRKVYLEAVKEGIISNLIDLGAIVTPAGCGTCFGALGGIPADGQNLFSTSNRNFPGRTGNPKANTYLGSPAMGAATAVTGYITDPREFL